MNLRKKTVLFLHDYNSILFRITLLYISTFSIIIIWNIKFDDTVSGTSNIPVSDTELFFRQTFENELFPLKDLDGWSSPVHPWDLDPVIQKWITFRSDSIIKLKHEEKYIPADNEKEKFINWFIEFATDKGYRNLITDLDSLKYITLSKFNRDENGKKGRYFYFYNSKSKKHYLYYAN